MISVEERYLWNISIYVPLYIDYQSLEMEADLDC